MAEICHFMKTAMKKLLSAVLSSIILLSMFSVPTFAQDVQEVDPTLDSFYDDFDGEELDRSKWLVSNKAWGGGDIGNGGVVPQNVSLSGNGTLVLESHGNNYSGDVPGIKRPDGTRTGGAIATRDYYASGSYEVSARISPDLGVCSAIWTFEYEEYYEGDPIYEENVRGNKDYYAINHEVDIELPGRPTKKKENMSFDYVLCNTWIGEYDDIEQTTSYVKLPESINLQDGEFHTYRFDWHTGDEGKGQEPCVEFYIDDQRVMKNTTHVPTKAGRFWIGAWFPDKWAGEADFDTSYFEIDYAKIEPFGESGDMPNKEPINESHWEAGSFPGPGPNPNPTPDPKNLILNGDFASGDSDWIISGDASISNGKAMLSSGSSTDTLMQTVTVKPNTTYELSADILSPGCTVDYGVLDYNGRYSDLRRTTNSEGKQVITFTTASHISVITVYFEVQRYQDILEPAYIDNVSLIEAS